MSFNYELSVEDIQSQAEALVDFHGKYRAFFQTKTRDNASLTVAQLELRCFLEAKTELYYQK